MLKYVSTYMSVGFENAGGVLQSEVIIRRISISHHIHVCR